MDLDGCGYQAFREKVSSVYVEMLGDTGHTADAALPLMVWN